MRTDDPRRGYTRIQGSIIEHAHDEQTTPGVQLHTYPGFNNRTCPMRTDEQTTPGMVAHVSFRGSTDGCDLSGGQNTPSSLL